MLAKGSWPGELQGPSAHVQHLSVHRLTIRAVDRPQEEQGSSLVTIGSPGNDKGLCLSWALRRLELEGRSRGGGRLSPQPPARAVNRARAAALMCLYLLQLGKGPEATPVVTAKAGRLLEYEDGMAPRGGRGDRAP